MATSMFIKYNNDNQYVLGYYDHEHNLLKAVKAMLSSGHKIHNVITPFPVHGLDHALGMKQTRIPTVGFLVGITCGILFLLFMLWINMYSYPLNFGGKPQFSLPAFIPIWFEVSVLTASIGMVVTFMYTCRLKPSISNEFNPIFDKKLTDDKMVIIFELKKGESIEGLENELKSNGALSVISKTLDEVQ